ncbi:uncharacterized protein HD556DRAFT_1362265 [Suillus plorans]|uniref:Uncharacterized protein n=1 Tax=Suillus plorans TaxID=116603 RepID=A0A9P7ASY8_9AGAM|nr:uncharacterized protein HD556DRAFT_1362265 [Suillus plorans]KAG1796004.1 hypothetical protein HD556DRAFT_1362265 [Suillus plorans]
MILPAGSLQPAGSVQLGFGCQQLDTSQACMRITDEMDLVNRAAYLGKKNSECSFIAHENKYKINVVGLERPQRRTPPVVLFYDFFIATSRTLQSDFVNTMKLVQIVYLTILAASSVAAGVTGVSRARAPQSITCDGPCASSSESLGCEQYVGTSPYLVGPGCWSCCT